MGNNCHNKKNNNLRHQSTSNRNNKNASAINHRNINNGNDLITDDCNNEFHDELHDKTDDSNSIGFLAEWINAYIFITRKSFHFYYFLYFFAQFFKGGRFLSLLTVCP